MKFLTDDQMRKLSPAEIAMTLVIGAAGTIGLRPSSNARSRRGSRS